MTLKIDDKEIPTVEEYIQQLEAEIKALKKRRELESELSDYWYERCVRLNNEMQLMRKER